LGATAYVGTGVASDPGVFIWNGLSFSPSGTFSFGQVDLRDWNGYDPTGTNAMDSIVNQALQQSLPLKYAVFAPAGTYAMANPISCQYQPNANFILVGAGGGLTQKQGSFPNYTRVLGSPPQTTFTFSDGTSCGLSITGAINSLFRGFALVGPNLAPNSIPTNMDVEACFIGAGIRNTQYSPNAGIAIDAFNGTAVPGDGGYTTQASITVSSAVFTNGSPNITVSNPTGALVVGASIIFNATVGTGSGGIVSGTTYWISAVNTNYTAIPTSIQVCSALYGASIIFNAGGSTTATASWYNPVGGVAGSSFLKFEDVGVLQWAVGIGVNFSGNGSLSDSITFKKCSVISTDIALAVCNGQNKIMHYEDGILSGRVNLDTLTYGSQNGTCPTITRCNMGGYRLFQCGGAYGALNLMSCYTEGTATIGDWGVTVSDGGYPCNIVGGEYYLTGDESPVQSRTNPYVINSPLGNVKFDGTYIQTLVGVAMNMGVSSYATPIQFSSCNLQGGSVAGQLPLIGYVINGPQYARLDNCLFNTSTYGAGLTYSDSGATIAEMTYANNAGRIKAMARTAFIDGGTTKYLYQPSAYQGVSQFNWGNISALTMTSQAITFTAGLANGAINSTLTAAWTNPTDFYPVTFSNAQVKQVLFTNGSTAVAWDWGGTNGLTSTANTSATVNNISVTFTAAAPLYMQVGDIFFWIMLAQGKTSYKFSVPAIQATSVNTGTGAVVCKLLYSPVCYDTVANQVSSAQAYTIPQQWAPSQALLCTVSGTTLSNVTPTTILINSDYITGSALGATTLSTNSRVVSGAGTATVTLNASGTTSPTVSTVVCAGAAGQFTCASGGPVVGDYILISGTNSGNTVFTPAYSNPTYYKVTAASGGTSFTLAQQSGAALTTSGTTTTGLTFTVATSLYFGRLGTLSTTVPF